MLSCRLIKLKAMACQDAAQQSNINFEFSAPACEGGRGGAAGSAGGLMVELMVRLRISLCRACACAWCVCAACVCSLVGACECVWWWAVGLRLLRATQ
jgi:hypothetical protein